MTFISLEFLVFFCIAIPLYFVLPFRARIFMMLIASLIFYAWGAAAATLVLVFSMLVDYAAGRLIASTENLARRRLYLAMSLCANLGVLFFFKYFNFFSHAVSGAINSLGIPFDISTLNVVLPIGISFYTFQSMAYTIDVYRRAIDAERDFPIYSLFVVFFPQLVAGPISRAGTLLRQIKIDHRWDYDRVLDGLRLILWGFFKKVVIGDYLAVYANTIYNAPQGHTGLPLIVATIFFAFQIYCDFSAYSDIAIGTARILGIDLMQNFRQPYFARSVREFWGRWHISLSTWFRDYLYIPLGGNRVPFPRQLLNLMIVFVASGFWHGANWTFLLWGALHGLFVVGDAVLNRNRPRDAVRNDSLLVIGAKIVGTFLLVNVAWIFFRANSIDDAGYIVSHLLQLGGAESLSFEAVALAGGWMPPNLLLAFGLIALLLIADAVDARVGLINFVKRAPLVIRWAYYYATTASVFVALNSFSIVQQFIYFRF